MKRELRKPGKTVLVLAENIKKLREQLQLSQEALADKCGLHRTYVGSVERGERNATLSTLEVLAEVLEVSVPELLTKKADDGLKKKTRR